MPSTDPLAHAAINHIHSGMTVGLGTGRAASRGIRALAERCKDDLHDIRCVATSRQSGKLAHSLGLNVLDVADVTEVDVLFDGADEVDSEMRMLKGGGGAMTLEKIVAHAAKKRIYLVQEAKLVTRLGTHMPLPIEVIPPAAG